MLARLTLAAAIAHATDPAVHRGKWFVSLARKTLYTVVYCIPTKSRVRCLAMLTNMFRRFLNHDIPQSSVATIFLRRAGHMERPSTRHKTLLLVFESLYMKDTR